MPLHLAFSPRYICLTIAVLGTVFSLLGLFAWPDQAGWLAPLLTLCGGFTALGIRDMTQTGHAILRNYPIAAHLRFLLEEIRPEMRQYFFEDEKHGTPFSRDIRAVIYQRAKMQMASAPSVPNSRSMAPALNG
jgi:hypothetical protein